MVGRRRSGSVLIMTLMFVTMFMVIFIALSGLINRSYREAVLQAQDELAFQIAEAGLNYARWRLAHDPENFTAEDKDISDQFAGTLGTYELTFDEPIEGGTTVTITSTGTTAVKPEREVVLRMRYGIPSLARYAFITNSDVWYSGTIKGAMHANGGIRMDGQSDNVIASAKETYTCQPIHGCNNLTKPGVWGTGEEQELWEFPVIPIDYNSLTLDLINMKDAAIAAGTYYGPSTVFGYHLVFNANNTYTIYKVTKKKGNVKSCDYEPTWTCTNGSHDINHETFLETKAVPPSGIIFIEDTLWVNGDIRSRVTVAAGNFPDTPSTNVDIILNGSITYGGVKDGTRSFAAIAQRHILIPYFAAPDDLTLDGAYVAQKGKFGRRYYNAGAGHDIKNALNRFGMIGSNAVPGTAWVNEQGEFASGYKEGTAEYDPNMLYAPPPYFPTSGSYEVISWEEL